MARALVIVALACGLAACSNQPVAPGEPNPPTSIQGKLEAAGVAGMPIYAGGDTPYAHALVYETTVATDGSFHFDLTSNPPLNRTDSCFTGTLINAAWGTWGEPPEGSGSTGAFFTFAVLSRPTGTGDIEYVVWAHTPEPQVLPYDCDDPGAGINLPAGWSTVLWSEATEHFIRRANTPVDAQWETRTLCFFQCAP